MQQDPFDYLDSWALDWRMAATRMVSLMVCILLCIACRGFAEDSQAPTPLTPKETIKGWNLEDKTVDQVLPLFEANTDVERQLARATAIQGIAEARLQKVARKKWGHDAEAVIAHLCLSDTREDDEAATVTTEGDHATVKYNVEGLGPLMLVRINGVWKVDTAWYVRNLAEQLQDAIKYCYRSSDVFVAAADSIYNNRYSNGQDAADDLKKAIDALGSGP